MTDKELNERTPDIYNYLIRHDLSPLSTKELQKLVTVSNDAHDGLMSGLQAIGNLSFWARANKNYTDNLAKEDLQRVSELLMHLPSIANAISLNAENAQCVIYQREGFPYTEVNDE